MASHCFVCASRYFTASSALFAVSLEKATLLLSFPSYHLDDICLLSKKPLRQANTPAISQMRDVFNSQIEEQCEQMCTRTDTHLLLSLRESEGGAGDHVHVHTDLWRYRSNSTGGTTCWTSPMYCWTSSFRLRRLKCPSHVSLSRSVQRCNPFCLSRSLIAPRGYPLLFKPSPSGFCGRPGA